MHVNTQLGYVAAVNSGGLDLLHNPLVVPLGGTSSPIETTLRDDGATVEGTIENWRSETQGRISVAANSRVRVPALGKWINA